MGETAPTKLGKGSKVQANDRCSVEGLFSSAGDVAARSSAQSLRAWAGAVDAVEISARRGNVHGGLFGDPSIPGRQWKAIAF